MERILTSSSTRTKKKKRSSGEMLLVMSLRAMSVVLVAAPAAEEEWLGPARACVVDRITENWLVARERGAREGKREREKKSRRRNESTL